jgi:hypothetical protein
MRIISTGRRVAMSKFIPLSGGKRTAIVDDDDYLWLTTTKWSDDKLGYAVRHKRKEDGSDTTEKMHRLIMKAKAGEQVDHVNGIPWDNRKENLRIVNNSQNSANKKAYSTNKSGYKGVAVYKKNKWTAQITVNYRKIHLGVFECKHEAAEVYNVAALKYFGEYARLNEIKE